jgi:hypothetical protein
MSIRVSNTDNQLNIGINGVLDVYNFDVIKSVSRALDTNGNYYIAINFIANDKNNSLRIPLKDVIFPPTWTNDTTGADNAIADIRFWMNEVISVNATITSPLGQQPMGDSVSTVLAYDQANVMINVGFDRYTNADGDTSGVSVLSISFASVGTANALVSVDGGMIYKTLAPGETLNLDAGGIMNFYNGNNFFWDTTTNVGSSLIVALNYL